MTPEPYRAPKSGAEHALEAAGYRIVPIVNEETLDVERETNG